MSQIKAQHTSQKPNWLKVPLGGGPRYVDLKNRVKDLKLFTVCQEAHCPNMGECWNEGTATIMILGGTCTRACRFCKVDSGNPGGFLDANEPKHSAETILAMGVDYIVITSVDRDDLPDGGAAHFAKTVRETYAMCPDIKIETLIPDFKGDLSHLKILTDAKPTVVAQNIECVERLTRTVRDVRAGYQQTLNVLKAIKNLDANIITKSSLTLGFGETTEEILQTMDALLAHDVEVLTLGQYLRPSSKHHPVVKYWTPEEFDSLGETARNKGFKVVASGPLVRSSYKAGSYIKKYLGERHG